MKFPWLALIAGAALAPVAFAATARADDVTGAAVIQHYGDLAAAMYGDALAAAQDLQKAVDAFVAAPSADTLTAARQAWIASRPWYQQTEGFRFGNAIVDDWEGRVNAWPLDEGLIDYVDTEILRRQFRRESALCRQRHRQQGRSASAMTRSMSPPSRPMC